MGDTRGFYYEPDPAESLSAEVVEAIAQAHDEDMLEQKWITSDDINADALNGLFQTDNLDTTLQFEADGATVTIVADPRGNPRVKVEPRSWLLAELS